MVTPFFDAEYLRNGTTYRHSFNEILIGTCTRPTQQCHFEWAWVILSDLAKYSMTWSIMRSLCDSWDSCQWRQEQRWHSGYSTKAELCDHCCLSVCLSFCLSVCLSFCLSVILFVCLSVILSVCLSVILFVCLSVILFVCLSVILFVCLSVILSVCLSFCLSVCLSYCEQDNSRTR